MARALENSSDAMPLLLGAGIVGFLWYANRERAAAKVAEASLLEADATFVPSTSAAASSEAPPPADLAPSGPAGADGAAVLPSPVSTVTLGPSRPTAAQTIDPFQVPTPRGQPVPAEDTNLWFYPMEEAKDLGAYGADEDKWWWQRGEGYIPDSVPFFGTRAGAQETLEEFVEAGARGAGQGITGRDPDDDEPLIPKWVWPVGIGGALVLGTIFVVRSTRKGA